MNVRAEHSLKIHKDIPASIVGLLLDCGIRLNHHPRRTRAACTGNVGYSRHAAPRTSHRADPSRHDDYPQDTSTGLSAGSYCSVPEPE